MTASNSKKVTRLLSFCIMQVFCFLTTFSQHTTVLPKKPSHLIREDIGLLKKILEANHPSLYWYTSKDSIDYYFDQTINSITDSLDEVGYKNKIAWLIAKIRCGHTSVRFSKEYAKIASLYRYPQFPLALKVWDDSLVVLASSIKNDSIFKRGTIITSINGMRNRQLLDTLYQFISTDGYSITYKSQLLSGNFPAWYKTIIGIDSTYNITYLDSIGNESSIVIKNFMPLIDTINKYRTEKTGLAEQPSRKKRRQLRLLEKRSILIDTLINTAFIRLTTFTGGKLKSFFRRSFKMLNKQHIHNLVIDMRENGGGNVGNSIRLTQYLTQQPFRIGDSVVAISRSFKYGRYIKSSFLYWIAMNFSAHKMKDGLIHYQRYEKHYYQPLKKGHFDGNIYLLQGGYTFSAASMSIAALKGQSNIKVIGEESGGGFYGNSAMHIPVIVLPNTGIQVSLPMYRLVMDASRTKGHGIIPDLEIKPSSEAIKKGIDLKIETIRSLIQKSNSSNDFKTSSTGKNNQFYYPLAV